ncbi:MAG: hypothetical protein WD066_18385, partial [Planctomycetaceae bacterium]
ARIFSGLSIPTPRPWRTRMEAKKKGRKKVVKRPQQGSTTAAASSSKGLNIGDLVATKKLIDQLGGAKQVRAALDALERLR